MTEQAHEPVAPEPHPRDEEVHDVLAAEEFAMPAPDAASPSRPPSLPADPSGETKPHDILAAEEFAMPAGRPSTEVGAPLRAPRRSKVRPVVGVLSLAGLAFSFLRRRRRRRATGA